MPWLYCTAHGREHENRAITRQDDYREEGESVLIVHGKLVTGGHHCDRCNGPLKRGDDAVLVSAFPRFVTEAMGYYDLAYERRYFDMWRASLAVYGAPWPSGAIAALSCDTINN
jgi:hypothetical protein